MPNSEILMRMDEKLDDVHARVARVEATIDQFQINIQRFYEKDMAPLIKSVSDNQKSIARLEIELAKLKTQIAIFGTIGVSIMSFAINLLIKYLNL